MTDIVMSEAPLPYDPLSTSTCTDLDDEFSSRDVDMHSSALAFAPTPATPATAATTFQARDPRATAERDHNGNRDHDDKRNDQSGDKSNASNAEASNGFNPPTAPRKQKKQGWLRDSYRGPGPTREITDSMAELMGAEQPRRDGEREPRGGGGVGGGGGGGYREDRRDGGAGGGGGGGGGFRRNDRKRRFR
ncbi:hypothetical protein LTS18_000744, partial [Coniosporium uncinatum]